MLVIHSILSGRKMETLPSEEKRREQPQNEADSEEQKRNYALLLAVLYEPPTPAALSYFFMSLKFNTVTT